MNRFLIVFKVPQGIDNAYARYFKTVEIGKEGIVAKMNGIYCESETFDIKDVYGVFEYRNEYKKATIFGGGMAYGCSNPNDPLDQPDAE